jgi:hypothetical protein
MQSIYVILLWLLLWFIIWSFYNKVFVPKGITFQRDPIKVIVFFTLLTLLMHINIVYFQKLYLPQLWFLLLGLFILLIAKYRKIIRRGGFMTLMAVYFDVVFQQLMVQILLIWLLTYAPVLAIYLFSACFFIGHLPILGLTHVKTKGKLIVLFSALIGAVAIYLFITSFSFGWIMSFALHYGFYIVIWFLLEKKSPMGIIN